MATASAPACWPNTARATRAHVPRSVTARTLSSPSLIPLLVNATTEQPSRSFSGVAGSSWSTTTSYTVPSAGATPLAERATMLVPVFSVSWTPAKFSVLSTAAVEMAPVPVAGEPVMYWATGRCCRPTPPR